MDECLSAYQESRQLAANHGEDGRYLYLLKELTNIVADAENAVFPMGKADSTLPNDANRLLWDSAAHLSNSRPPANFVVQNRNGDTTLEELRDQGNNPPIFDGSVANSTPPSLGGIGTGSAGGVGTILHLACALDSPLALAFLLVMGADARAPHTAFRRLMIHEAACNGSIDCLQLLLELGKKYSTTTDENDFNRIPPQITRVVNRAGFVFTDAWERTAETAVNGSGIGAVFGDRSSVGTGSLFPRYQLYTPKDEREKEDFVYIIQRFVEVTKRVREGFLSELEAARSLLEKVCLPETTQSALVRSCTFSADNGMPGSFLRSQGCADGHGNTPLHWAAFKNETDCVSLLLRYSADANARAHPSGWTPLHDAAYSNSSESVELLVNAGAHVDVRATSGATPLCFAAQEDAADAAQLLLDRGADLSARCAAGGRDDIIGGQQQNLGNQPHSRFSGYTPLHYCAHYNAYNAARALLTHMSARTAMDIPDLSERLPIHVAVARGSSDVLRELLRAGARVETPARVQRLSPLRAQSAPISPPRPRPVPERPVTPPRASTPTVITPVSSPLLRSMIPARPVTSSKPWNCLSQRSIDECRDLISLAEQNWAPERHALFTPADRLAVLELLRVGKRLELTGTGIFVDLWPLVLSFCGRGWFDVEEYGFQPMMLPPGSSYDSDSDDESYVDGNGEIRDGIDHLSLPSLRD